MYELLTNPHPGIILKEEFLEKIGLSGNKLAEKLGVPGNRINDVVRGKRGLGGGYRLAPMPLFRLVGRVLPALAKFL